MNKRLRQFSIRYKSKELLWYISKNELNHDIIKMVFEDIYDGNMYL